MERAHAALGPLTVEERASLLGHLVSVAVDWKSPRARDWDEELFQSANGLSGRARRRAQYAAVNVMAQLDLTRAVAMLAQMDPDPPREKPDQPEPQLRGQATSRLVEVIWGKYKQAGIPVIRQLAAQLAQSGGYPYASIASVITRLGSSAPELTEQLFRDTLAAYRQETSPEADANFSGFLMPISQAVARASAKEAFELLVQNTLAHGDSGAPIQFSGGATLSRAEASLRQILPVMRTVDPELAQEIVRDHPAITKAAGTPMFIAPARPRSAEQTADLQRMQELDRGETLLRQSDDPKVLAQAMPDVETRAMVYAQTAQYDVNRDPAKARAELQQAYSLADQLDDAHARLRALSSVAWSADAVGDQGIRRQVIEEAFPIAERLVRDEFDSDGHYKPGEASEALSRLVQLGMETDPEATLARIDQVSIPILRAGLLVDAASAALPPPPAKKTAPAR